MLALRGMQAEGGMGEGGEYGSAVCGGLFVGERVGVYIGSFQSLNFDF